MEDPGSRMTKGQVNYTDHAEHSDQECDGCKYFRDPNACQIVQGRISPEGWCEKFEPIDESGGGREPEPVGVMGVIRG